MKRTGPSGGLPFRIFVLAAAIAASLTGGADLTAQGRRAAAAYDPRGFSKANRPVTPELAAKAQLRGGYGNLPLSFEANQGQSNSKVKFLSRGSGHSLFLTSNEAVLVLSQTGADESREESIVVGTAVGAKHSKSAVLRMTMANANPQPRAAGHDELPGKSNYFIGNDPAKWHTNIPQYAKVRYENVYPGVDLVYYGDQRQLEYDFVVAPGADPGLITLAFDGARDVHIDARSELVLGVDDGELRQHKPVVYQEVAGVKQEVAGRYVMKGKRQVGFRVAAYDPSRPLIIDPVLVYSTYLGGTSFDFPRGIAVDGAGNAYVTGFTSSTNFPTTAGAAQTASAGSNDAFVTKLNATGTALVYSTYLGGSGGDTGGHIVVDGAGYAYVTGGTSSTDFPATSGAFQTANAGNGDAFVTKLDTTGSALVYSTYLGGGGSDGGAGIVLDGAGNAYVTGGTSSTNFPTTSGAFQTINAGGSNDAFVTKLDATGSALVYSTYLGGGGSDSGSTIAIDGVGSAYVRGQTTSTNFPTTAGVVQPTSGGVTDAFVTKLDPTGSTLAYSTYLGGSANEVAVRRGLAVDAGGNAYIAGQTASADFPTTAGAVQPTYAGNTDAFVTKLNATGSALVYSTYLGGSNFDFGFGIAIDAAGSAYVTGGTFSTNFPTTSGAIQSTNAGLDDAFVTKLDATGSTLLYSTYLGGNGLDFGHGIVLDGVGNAYVAGEASSTNFPTTPGAVQTARGGTFDAFVAKIEFVGPPATLILSPAVATNPVNTQHCVTATVQDGSANPTPGITVRFGVAGSITTSGSATTDGNGQATFCYVGPTTLGADGITAYADTNNNTVQDPGEPGGAAAKTWVAGAPATLTLSPATASNPVNTQHCVTATVQDVFTNPTPNITVRFSVTGASATSGSATTDSSGRATFCYMGPTTPGADGITAFADTDNNTAQDPGEPGGAATKTWVAGAPATLTLFPATASNPVNTQHCVTATVKDAFANPTPGVTVRFSVTGAVNTSGSAATNPSGQASFCYAGPTVTGADAITAFADTNNNATKDSGEPSGAATKTWFLPLPTSTDQCKNGGWKTFGVFKNQGDCVSFVTTKGKNPPSLP